MATNDDIRAAAERCKDLFGTFVDFDNMPIECIKDLFVLAQAYIAEHPADDDEPVTDEWLDSVFGTDDSLCTEWHDEWGEKITWLDKFGLVSIPMPKTRGDVRRLCRALGIELNESVLTNPRNG